jgi:predicted enzyme related to lactoylglutathione lyase
MNEHEKINYVEFPAKDIENTKVFFTKAFDWTFVDYGPDYTAFSGEGLDGGFFRADLSSSSKSGSALIIFYSNDLSQTQAKVEEAGGTILQEIYEFPGGRRFHFAEPSGNEFAVWSDVT